MFSPREEWRHLTDGSVGGDDEKGEKQLDIATHHTE